MAAKGITEQLESANIGEIISGVALGIADGQTALDMNSIRTAIVMSGTPFKDENGEETQVEVNIDEDKYSMMELGFSPTFYQFVDTLIEVRVAFSVSREKTESTKEKRTEGSAGVGFLAHKFKVSGSTMNASYSSKYNFSGEASSFVRTKLVPVPAPALLGEILAAKAQAKKETEGA